jgi:hypothetical protein
MCIAFAQKGEFYMLALEMEKTAVKNFMGNLLREDIFDTFEARTVEISATTRITIECRLESGFSTWAEVRPLVYEIIKICKKPRCMKIIFSRKDPQEIHTNAAALFLNLVYENDGVTFTTAVAQKEFVPDKSLDAAWDSQMREFFEKIGVVVLDRE